MIIRLKGVKNVRDFSEYGCEGYIRSAHLHELTERDIDMLVNKYNLKTIVDLRTTKEVEEKPDVELPGVKHIHIPIFDEVMPGISHEEETDEFRSMIPDMREFYHGLVTEEPYVSQIRKVMEIIADPDRDGAVLWHCTEGKDRCGIISALFLLSKGVEPEHVMKDYLMTNRVNSGKSWKYYVLVWLKSKDKELAASVKNAFLAKREYMEPIMGILEELAQNSIK